MRDILDNCINLATSRNLRYGDSWRVLTVQSIANLCEMKLHRIARLGSDSKTKDELQDTINYCVFALKMLQEEEKEIYESSNHNTNKVS